VLHVYVYEGTRLVQNCGGGSNSEEDMQTENRVLDSLARLLTDAAGAAKSLRGEVETVVKQRLDRLAADMKLVPREEFEAVKAMVAKARTENERLAARVGVLEAELGVKSTAKTPKRSRKAKR
jgi:BMFP domain-containing protein YqiC